MRASIIIVNHSGRADLERSLPSVLSTLTPENEVIVVDNGSTDGSADWVSEEFPAIRLIRSRVNGGSAAAATWARTTHGGSTWSS